MNEELGSLDRCIDEGCLEFEALGCTAEEVPDAAQHPEQQVLVLRLGFGKDDRCALIDTNNGLVLEQDAGPAVLAGSQTVSRAKLGVRSG